MSSKRGVHIESLATKPSQREGDISYAPSSKRFRQSDYDGDQDDNEYGFQSQLGGLGEGQDALFSSDSDRVKQRPATVAILDDQVEKLQKAVVRREGDVASRYHAGVHPQGGQVHDLDYHRVPPLLQPQLTGRTPVAVSHGQVRTLQAHRLQLEEELATVRGQSALQDRENRLHHRCQSGKAARERSMVGRVRLAKDRGQVTDEATPVSLRTSAQSRQRQTRGQKPLGAELMWRDSVAFGYAEKGISDTFKPRGDVAVNIAAKHAAINRADEAMETRAPSSASIVETVESDVQTTTVGDGVLDEEGSLHDAVEASTRMRRSRAPSPEGEGNI